MPDASPTVPPLLSVQRLCAWHGESQALHGMTFEVRKGEVVTLLGRNGAGKSTTLKSIMGLIQRRSGEVTFAGRNVIALPPEAIGRLGIAFCPEERGIYASLTVEENLMLPPKVAPGGMTVAELYDLFPNLRERRQSFGTRLSGGEQQMLAIGRILRTGATLLLLDEPTEGLAPVIVDKIGAVIQTLKARGYTILLVEQNAHFAATVADRHYIVEHGQVVDMIHQAEFSRSGDRIDAYLTV
ncbi:ABC transporter ATP-binding protein [Azospirillum canadense]|uniref:ABC transporter ATP-binding protein n=1 Tax=Azospirillum canadense TaxID=403962 RepID=UPI002226F2FC|nr:ABC transporter ATP-binding protein [Azospirillum canadense]MCW2241822.1 branched-chain amino acid transport system ATP-binding protein [Azospirillum canadense]